MTNATDAIKHRALVAQLISLVTEVRSLRLRMAEEGATTSTFADVAETLVDLSPSAVSTTCLRELGEILDRHSSEEIDADLDSRWRLAMSSSA